MFSHLLGGKFVWCDELGDISLVTSRDDGGDDIQKIWTNGSGLLFAAGGTSGLRSYTINYGTGVLTPVSVDDQGGDYFGVTGGPDNILLVSCGGAGLRTYSYDVSGNLTYIATDNQGGAGNEYINAWYDGTWVYCACYWLGFRTYSVSSLGALTFGTHSAAVGGQYNDVYFDGNFVYFACRAGGLTSYSVDEFGVPTFLDQDLTGASSSSHRGVWGDGKYVYVANQGAATAGLMSHSINPVTGEITWIDTVPIGDPQKVHGDGTLLYVAGLNSGFTTVQVDAVTGILTVLDNYGGAGVSYLDAHSDGTYVYVGQFGPENLYTFSVDLCK